MNPPRTRWEIAESAVSVADAESLIVKDGRTIRKTKTVVGWTCSMESRMINDQWRMGRSIYRDARWESSHHLLISSCHVVMLSCCHVVMSVRVPMSPPDFSFRFRGRRSSCRCVPCRFVSSHFVSTLPGAAGVMHHAWFGISIARCGCHHLSVRCIREACSVHWTFLTFEPYGFECSDG